MSKNIFETYEINGRTYTDNLGENAFISIPKKQYIEYEQQREEINRLNNIINELEKVLDEELENYGEQDVDMEVLYIRNKLKELKEDNK